MTYQMSNLIPEWTEDAACVEHQPDTFYPGIGQRTTAKHARAICDRCLVQTECLTYAMAIEAVPHTVRHGIWGGTTPAQRDSIANQRGAR